MANRAYLFCSDAGPDDPCTWIDLDSDRQIYYDSRHNIPLSWFFFFQPADVKLIDKIMPQGYLKDVSYWQEPKFMAGKNRALDTFRSREALLARIVGTGFYCDAYEYFLPRIESMPGNCLCMDPAEVAQGDEEDFAPLKHILELVADVAVPLDALKEALRGFSTVDNEDEDRFVVNTFGHTYGDLLPGTLSRMPEAGH